MILNLLILLYQLIQIIKTRRFNENSLLLLKKLEEKDLKKMTQEHVISILLIFMERHKY